MSIPPRELWEAHDSAKRQLLDHVAWRASSVGVYRLWRDLGYAIGALLAGVTADAFGLDAAMWVFAALTFASGLVAAVRMTETLTRRVAAGPSMHLQGA